MNSDYSPEGPYVIQSGKHQGECLEVIFFQNYPFLGWLRTKCESGLKDPENKNKLHKHLIWMLRQGENRKAKIICPFCRKNTATHFSVKRNPFGISISVSYVSCSEKECQEKLTDLALGKNFELLPLKFSSLNRFSIKSDRKEVMGFFKKAFGIKGRITREKAFEFLNR